MSWFIQQLSLEQVPLVTTDGWDEMVLFALSQMSCYYLYNSYVESFTMNSVKSSFKSKEPQLS